MKNILLILLVLALSACKNDRNIPKAFFKNDAIETTIVQTISNALNDSLDIENISIIFAQENLYIGATEPTSDCFDTTFEKPKYFTLDGLDLIFFQDNNNLNKYLDTTQLKQFNTFKPLFKICDHRSISYRYKLDHTTNEYDLIKKIDSEKSDESIILIEDEKYFNIIIVEEISE